jgi:hypothetical protein
MAGSAGTTSRWVAASGVALDQEIEAIADALRRHGPADERTLKDLVRGRHWGPGRFRTALRRAVADARVRRLPDHSYVAVERPAQRSSPSG